MIEIIGEKSKKLIAEDKKFVSPSYTRVHPIVIESAKGCYVCDVEGKNYLDFASGIAVCTTGHCHPAVVRAIQEQAELLLHLAACDFCYPQIINLAKKLAEIVPGGPNRRTFFCNSGTEAIEGAIKLSRWWTKRKFIIAYYNSFHGRTYGALSLTASKVVQREWFGPFLPGIIHVPYPYCYRCSFNLTCTDCNFYCIKYIEEEIFKKIISPEEVAAFFIEPIQGEGGYIVPPDGYFNKLKELLDKYNILLVDDEVQAGMGRTGKMFAIEHWGIIPEIVCLAKGIASGMPLGAVVAKRSIMSWPEGAHASTFGGNPLSCEAALVTIKLLEEGLVENAKNIGEYMINKLKEIQNDYEFIGDVRGKGLMIGLEIVKDRKTKEKEVNLRNKIIYKCYEKGLLLLPCGENVIRIAPPLIITKEEADKGMNIFSDALKI